MDFLILNGFPPPRDFVKHKDLALCEPYLVWSFVHWMERCNNSIYSIVYNSRFTICDKII